MNCYLIRVGNGKVVLYSEAHLEEARVRGANGDGLEADRLTQWIRKLRKRDTRLSKFLARAMEFTRDTYEKLEDRIDPMEKTIKHLRTAAPIRVFFAYDARGEGAAEHWQQLLTRQRWKHFVWCGVDGVVTLIMILISPFIVPLPGPNIFFYYPLIRTASHYFAFRGATRAAAMNNLQFVSSPALAEIEYWIHRETNRNILIRRIRPFVEELQWREFLPFLRRYV